MELKQPSYKQSYKSDCVTRWFLTDAASGSYKVSCISLIKF